MSLETGLRGCDSDLGAYADAAVRRFGPAALGFVELPSMEPQGATAAELRGIAALLWCREVENGGLLQFAEQLAERFATSRVWLDVGKGGAEALVHFHRRREERFSAAERLALYARVFGGDASPEPNDAYGRAWRILVERLATTPRVPTEADRVRLALAARSLAASARGVGMVRFAAERIVAQFREALALLRNPEVARALGPAGPLEMVRWHGRSILGRDVDPTAAVARGEAGAAVVRWVSEHLPAIQAGSVEIDPRDPVVAAAVTLLDPPGSVG